MTTAEREDLGAKMAQRAVAAASPWVLAAAKSLCRAERIPWDGIDVRQQYTFISDAAGALDAGLESLTSPEQLARIVSVTGLSLQTVTEVAKELRRG